MKMPIKEVKMQAEMRSSGRRVGVGICYPTRNNVANVLLSSHMLSPISLHSFLPSLGGAFWLTQYDISPKCHPSTWLCF